MADIHHLPASRAATILQIIKAAAAAQADDEPEPRHQVAAGSLADLAAALNALWLVVDQADAVASSVSAALPDGAFARRLDCTEQLARAAALADSVSTLLGLAKGHIDAAEGMLRRGQ